MHERDYQAKLIKKIRRLLPGCIILKNDSGYQQGIPDLTILHLAKWGFLEVKLSATSPEEPNQRYFIEHADSVAFGAFIYPENEREVLHDLQFALQPCRSARVS